MSSTKVEKLTVEYVRGGWWLCQRGCYTEESVLSGQAFRQLVKSYDSLDEAKVENPQAEVTDEVYIKPFVPVHPPSWFDPMDAGERWDDDY